MGHQGIDNLGGEPLLNLGAACVQLNETGQLAQSGDLAVRAGQVADMGVPVEGEEVMFAGRVEGDVLDQH